MVEAALRQAGIARFRSTEAMVHYLKVLALPPLRGNRLVVLSRSGGHAVITADECESHGFELAALPPDFLEGAQQSFRAKVVRLTNPMDLGDLFDLEVYGALAQGVLAMPEVDGMVLLHTYEAGYEGPRSEELFRRLHQISRKADKPLAVYANTAAAEITRLKGVLPGPIFDEPADAVQALAMRRDLGGSTVARAERPEGPADAGPVQAILARCRAEGRDPRLPEALEVVAAYGVPVRRRGGWRRGPAAAAAAAESLGFPVALKAVGTGLSHKSDVGGVQAEPARSRPRCRPPSPTCRRRWRPAPRAPAMTGALVQPMAAAGHDLIVGANFDPNFGHVVLAGLGGIFVEVLGDAALRVAPFGRAHRRGDAAGAQGVPHLRRAARAGPGATSPPWSR